MSRRDDFAEACIAYFEACEAHREKVLRRPRQHVNGCKCDPCVAIGDTMPEYIAICKAEERARSLRPQPEAVTESDRRDVRGDEKMEERRTR